MSYYGGTDPSPYDYPRPDGPTPRGDVVVTGLTGGYDSEKKGKGRFFKGRFKGGFRGKHKRHFGGHKRKGFRGKHKGVFRRGRKHK
ncbi:unnamed protein product [Closterium sp. NIES-53]